jgi:RNA polymerase sigma-70 factor (ECF subfamily)
MSTSVASSGLERFEEQRPYLLGIAYRMTGSFADAEDLVQEAWLRWQGTDGEEVTSPRAYLATTVTRLALDHLKSARHRREEYPGEWLPEPVAVDKFDGEAQPERAVELRESLSYAFMVLLERLTPAERAVFLLRDVFDYDYREIAPVIEKSEAACRQIIHRARAQLAEGRPRFHYSFQEQARLLEAFARAAAAGDMEGLTHLLAEDVVSIGDGGGKRPAALRPLAGRDRVVKFIVGAVKSEQPDLVRLVELNGEPAILTWVRGELRNVFFVAADEDGRIAAIFAVRNPDKLLEAEQAARARGQLPPRPPSEPPMT